WQVPLYVTARGLGTSLIPYGARAFDMELDLGSSLLTARTTDGGERVMPLHDCTLAAFFADYTEALAELDIEVNVNPLVVEIVETIHLDSDEAPRRYDPASGAALHEALVRVDGVFKAFRGEFVGKASPVHFFWGSFDLAASRFS